MLMKNILLNVVTTWFSCVCACTLNKPALGTQAAIQEFSNELKTKNIEQVT